MSETLTESLVELGTPCDPEKSRRQAISMGSRVLAECGDPLDQDQVQEYVDKRPRSHLSDQHLLDSILRPGQQGAHREFFSHMDFS